MKLCQFHRPVTGPTLGLIDGDWVYDLGAVSPVHFGSMAQMLRNENMNDSLTRAMGEAKSREALPLIEMDITPDPSKPHLLAPLGTQEVWAAGVTYQRSREARMEESADGGSFYDKVYRAPRPELFFKATPNRVVGPNQPLRIRSDSKWNVPEPELALVINSRGQIVAFTIGNDMSSRDIEGENPLYLPQAKIYMGCCALGPALLLASTAEDPRRFTISISVRREAQICFEASTAISRMKRGFGDLISYLVREQEFPNGVVLLTGTGIVPPDDFTLQSGDIIEIIVPEIGTLRNPVA